MFARTREPWLRDALADTPVVMIVGPRQVGKSTLANLVADLGFTYVTLDDPDTLYRAQANPAGFIAAQRLPVAIDEVQRAPELLPAIKAAVDRDRQPGRFLLTGSANVLALPKVSESLAGRMEVLELWPLTQAEIAGSNRNLVDDFFRPEVWDDQFFAAPLTVADWPKVSTTGGFPEPLARQPKRQEAWFQSYLRTLVERDARDLANIEGLTQLPRLLKLLATQTGATLNVSSLSRETGIAATTLTRYLDLLKALFLVFTVPAWSADLEVRLTRTPKAYLIDSGLAEFLAGSPGASDWDRKRRQMEAFLACELHRLCTMSDIGVELFHLRTVKNKEVPFLLETRDGRLFAVDFEPQNELPPGAIERIQYVQSIAPDAFVGGVLLTPTGAAKRLDEKIVTLPVGAFR